jgi:NADPH:quinone reductase
VAWVDIDGSYAGRIVADPDRLVPVPDGISSELAAASLLQGMTAHYLAWDSYPIEAGDWVVVHAAAGGVGLILTQLAKLRGGHVIATTSTSEKAELAWGAGADRVIGYDGFAERVPELAGGEGAAAVYDGIGKATFLDGLRVLRPTGRMILYGAASGQPDPLVVASLAAAGSLYVQRPTLVTYTRTPELLQERAAAVFALIEEGRLDVRIGARYPLHQARQAHEDLEGRRTTGKCLLLVNA